MRSNMRGTAFPLSCFVLLFSWNFIVAGLSPVVACNTHSDCDDGRFCNGEERCLPVPGGNGNKVCFPSKNPPCNFSDAERRGMGCYTNMLCNEAEARCECEPCPDEDRDGHRDVSCGGDDCDDSDPDRFPGNPEDCDAEGHDEDCDPYTIGDKDVDSDGFIDSACFNYLPR